MHLDDLPSDQAATLKRLHNLVNRLADTEASKEEPAPVDMFGNSLEPERVNPYEYE